MSDAFYRRLDEYSRIPLWSILVDFGLTPHRDDGVLRYQNARELPGRVYDVVVCGRELWYDTRGWTAGRGAVDLVLHLHFGVPSQHATNEHRERAIDWLRDFTAKRGATPTEFSEQDALNLVERDEAAWPLARRHLIDSYRIPGDLVDRLHQMGDIAAAHIVGYPGEIDLCWTRHDVRHQPRGVALQALDHPLALPRLIGPRDGWFSVGNRGGAKAVLVAGPIEALSYVALTQPADTVVHALPTPEVPHQLIEAAHALDRMLVYAFPETTGTREAFAQCRSRWQDRYGDRNFPCWITPNGPTWGDDLHALPSLGLGRSQR